MKKFKPLIIFMTAFSAVSAVMAVDQGEVSVDIINRYLELGINPSTINPCNANNLEERLSLTKNNECNDNIRSSYRSTQRFSIYSLFHQERPFDTCTTDILLSPEELKEAQMALSKMSDRDGLYQHFAFQCQEEIGTSNDDYSFHSTMVQAAHNLRQKQLEATALQSMRGLNNLDNILGRDFVEKDIHCNANISSFVKTSCEKFKSCPKRRNRVFLNANMTLDALKTDMELDGLIEDSQKKIKKLKSEMRRTSSEVRDQKRKQIEQIEFVIEDLKSNKEEVLATIPWINGREFNKEINKVKNRIQEELSDESLSPEIIKAKRRSLLSDIGHTMVKQFKADRKELLKRYDDANQAISCLDQRKECHNFDEIISLSPPINLEEFEENTDPALTNAYKLIKANQCVDDKSNSVSTYNEVAIDVASIGAGFLVGGVGGFVRLASVAGRMYVRGNRIKGLASAAALGLEGASLAKQGSDALNSCSMARRNLANFQDAETAVACDGNDLQMTVMNNYRKCLTDIAFLSASAVAGLAPDIVRGLRKTSTPLAENAENLERVQDLIYKSTKLNQAIPPRIKEVLIGLGIRSDEIEDFKTLMKKIDFKSNKNLDNETTIVFFNQLSAKDRKIFLKNYPTNIDKFAKEGLPKGRANFRLRRVAKHYNSVHRKMAKTYKKAYDKEYQKLINSGLPRGRAHIEAQATARATRQRQQNFNLGCRANKITEQHRKGAKLFTNFTVGFGLTTTAATFTMANSDRPKDFDFYKDLSYELSMAVILSKIGAKIQSRPSNTLRGRYGQATAVSSAVGVLDATIFANVYDISDEEIEDQIQRIQNNPDQVKALEKYNKYFDEGKVMERIEQSLMNQFEHSLKQPEMKEYYNQREIVIGGTTFAGPLNSVSLQDPNLKIEISRAIMQEFYDDAKGTHGTGNLFADKYLYDRGYNALVGIPRNMVAGYMTYATLCRNADQPIKGLTQAMAIQAVNQSIGGYLYYDLRKDFVGR